MLHSIYKIKELGERAYLPAPEQGEPDGLWRRQIVLTSDDHEESELDEIIATLWDYPAFLDLHVGDKVLATLRFFLCSMYNGGREQAAEVVEIQRLTEYRELNDF